MCMRHIGHTQRTSHLGRPVNTSWMMTTSGWWLCTYPLSAVSLIVFVITQALPEMACSFISFTDFSLTATMTDQWSSGGSGSVNMGSSCSGICRSMSKRGTADNTSQHILNGRLPGEIVVMLSKYVAMKSSFSVSVETMLITCCDSTIEFSVISNVVCLLTQPSREALIALKCNL